MKIKKRGISPVIATVLLVAMVIVIGLIIFLWFRGMMVEYVEKHGKNIELVCADIDFDATYYYGDLNIVNNGNVPIFGMKIKIFKEGSHETKNLNEISNWPNSGLNQGGTFTSDISSYTSGVNKVVLIPVLMGSSEKGEKTFMCNEDQYGLEIDI